MKSLVLLILSAIFVFQIQASPVTEDQLKKAYCKTNLQIFNHAFGSGEVTLHPEKLDPIPTDYLENDHDEDLSFCFEENSKEINERYPAAINDILNSIQAEYSAEEKKANELNINVESCTNLSSIAENFADETLNRVLDYYKFKLSEISNYKEERNSTRSLLTEFAKKANFEWNEMIHFKIPLAGVPKSKKGIVVFDSYEGYYWKLKQIPENILDASCEVERYYNSTVELFRKKIEDSGRKIAVCIQELTDSKRTQNHSGPPAKSDCSKLEKDLAEERRAHQQCKASNKPQSCKPGKPADCSSIQGNLTQVQKRFIICEQNLATCESQKQRVANDFNVLAKSYREIDAANKTITATNENLTKQIIILKKELLEKSKEIEELKMKLKNGGKYDENEIEDMKRSIEDLRRVVLAQTGP